MRCHKIISPLLEYTLSAAAGLIIVAVSAGYIINAVSDYARKTGISDYLIGFLVVAFGTSLPELTTAIVASLNKNSNIVLGDLIGASIIDVTIVLGLTSIIGRKIFVQGKIINKTLFNVIIMAMLPLLLGVDGSFSRLDGVILVIAFVVYLISLIKKEGKLGEVKKQLAWKDIWQDMVVIAGCVFALLFSAFWFIRSTIKIASLLDVPQFILGLVLVAFMTTLPELIIEIRSVLKGSTGIAFGDILGSVVMNTTLILGIAAIIRPIVFVDQKASFINAAFFMVTSVYIALLFIKKKEISWQEGLGLIMLYLTFLITEGLSGYF
jgi:cation:H+ antiporter